MSKDLGFEKAPDNNTIRCIDQSLLEPVYLNAHFEINDSTWEGPFTLSVYVPGSVCSHTPIQ